MEEEENALAVADNEDEYDNEPILAPTTDYLRELTLLPKFFPERLKTLYWAYYGKDIMLAKLDKGDLLTIKNQVGLIVAVAHITQPDYEYTASQLLDYTNLKHHTFHQCLRGKDGHERLMETLQTRMAITRNELPQTLVSPRRQGFFSRVFGGGRR